jgi:hypothetical protein
MTLPLTVVTISLAGIKLNGHPAAKAGVVLASKKKDIAR